MKLMKLPVVLGAVSALAFGAWKVVVPAPTQNGPEVIYDEMMQGADVPPSATDQDHFNHIINQSTGSSLPTVITPTGNPRRVIVFETDMYTFQGDRVYMVKVIDQYDEMAFVELLVDGQVVKTATRDSGIIDHGSESTATLAVGLDVFGPFEAEVRWTGFDGMARSRRIVR